jgi:long-chain acyl-CoA synthetase
VLRFFDILGLPVYQVYGMTESGGVIFQRPGGRTAGQLWRHAARALNWKIAEDGEI